VYRAGSVPTYDPPKHTDFKGLLSLSSRERQNQLGEGAGSVRSPDSWVQRAARFLPFGSGFDNELGDAVVAQRELEPEIDHTAGEISLEMVGRQVVVFVDPLGGGELDGVGVFAG
jgi:hypothetical protein